MISVKELTADHRGLHTQEYRERRRQEQQDICSLCPLNGGEHWYF